MRGSVFQRLGLPAPSSISKWTSPAWGVLERPSPVAVPFLNQIDGLPDALVGLDAGSPQIVQTLQDVVMPASRKRKLRPVRIDHLSG
jgi:hypothetical protein